MLLYYRLLPVEDVPIYSHIILELNFSPHLNIVHQFVRDLEISTQKMKIILSFCLCNLKEVQALKYEAVVNKAFLFCCGECVRGLFLYAVLLILKQLKT